MLQKFVGERSFSLAGKDPSHGGSSAGGRRGPPLRGRGYPPSGGTAFLEKPWEKHQKGVAPLDSPFMGHSLPLVLGNALVGSCEWACPFRFLIFLGYSYVWSMFYLE